MFLLFMFESLSSDGSVTFSNICVYCSTVYPAFKVQTTSTSLMLCDFATFSKLCDSPRVFHFSCCIQFCFRVSVAITQATALANTLGAQAFVYLLSQFYADRHRFCPKAKSHHLKNDLW